MQHGEADPIEDRLADHAHQRHNDKHPEHQIGHVGFWKDIWMAWVVQLQKRQTGDQIPILKYICLSASETPLDFSMLFVQDEASCGGELTWRMCQTESCCSWDTCDNRPTWRPPWSTLRPFHKKLPVGKVCRIRLYAAHFDGVSRWKPIVAWPSAQRARPGSRNRHCLSRD